MTPRPSIWNAAFTGKLRHVQAAVEYGVDLEELGPDGSNALHLAAMAGHRDVVEYLLDSGAHIDALDADGFNVVQVAIMAAGQKPSARLELLELLISRGADLTHEAPAAGNLVETAQNYGRSKKLIELLTRHGAPARPS